MATSLRALRRRQRKAVFAEHGAKYHPSYFACESVRKTPARNSNEYQAIEQCRKRGIA